MNALKGYNEIYVVTNLYGDFKLLSRLLEDWNPKTQGLLILGNFLGAATVGNNLKILQVMYHLKKVYKDQVVILRGRNEVNFLKVFNTLGETRKEYFRTAYRQEIMYDIYDFVSKGVEEANYFEFEESIRSSIESAYKTVGHQIPIFLFSKTFVTLSKKKIFFNPTIEPLESSRGVLVVSNQTKLEYDKEAKLLSLGFAPCTAVITAEGELKGTVSVYQTVTHGGRERVEIDPTKIKKATS